MRRAFPPSQDVDEAHLEVHDGEDVLGQITLAITPRSRRLLLHMDREMCPVQCPDAVFEIREELRIRYNPLRKTGGALSDGGRRRRFRRNKTLGGDSLGSGGSEGSRLTNVYVVKSQNRIKDLVEESAYNLI